MSIKFWELVGGQNRKEIVNGILKDPLYMFEYAVSKVCDYFDLDFALVCSGGL